MSTLITGASGSGGRHAPASGPIPFPHALDDRRFRSEPSPAPVAPVADRVRETMEEFAGPGTAGRLDTRELA